MKYFVTVNGAEHEVELREERGRIVVHYDGKPVRADYEEVDRLGQVALFLEDRSYAVSIEGSSQEAAVTVAGHLYAVEIEDERERAAHQADRARGSGGGDVKSVMPGIVVELLVEEGQEVAEGQPLLILEAMKMQNEIGAPSAGRVAKLFVQQGEAVASGAKLVSLTAPDPAD